MNVHSANRSGKSKRVAAKRGGAAETGGKRTERSERGDQRGRGRPLVDDKRRIILDAALRVFAAKGYHGTAVPDVADAAGVGTGTLYRYFANKQALVNVVYRDAKIRLRTAVLDDV